MLSNNVRRVTNDHVNGKELPFWDAGVTLILEYSPDPISQAMTLGFYIRRDEEPGACGASSLAQDFNIEIPGDRNSFSVAVIRIHVVVQPCGKDHQ